MTTLGTALIALPAVAGVQLVLLAISAAVLAVVLAHGIIHIRNRSWREKQLTEHATKDLCMPRKGMTPRRGLKGHAREILGGR